MSLLETIEARVRVLETEAETVLDPTLVSATIVSGGGERSTLRELPRISVDVRGTLPTGGHTASEARVRDLEVIDTLGEGGMGRVFLARQHSLEREVAIKTLRDGASDRDRRALIAEGAVTGYLEHPAIVPVHALGLDEHGQPVLVMKRVLGEPWSKLLDTRPDDLEEHLAVLLQVCNAVEFAHSRGILHRDLKPQNVLVGAYGEVQLCDFGVALRLADVVDDMPLAGTPAYMAPEMVVGGALDVRTDVYLLGATLHHVLTGTVRHEGTTVRETLIAAAKSRPFAYSSSVPQALAVLANDATAPDPRDRPQTVGELRKRLQDHLRHKASIALASAALERVRSLGDDNSAGSEILAAEARLALKHALDEWPENEVARAALTDLESLLEARRARHAELEALAHDHDPKVAHRQRLGVTIALLAVGLALSVAGVVRGNTVTTRGLFFESLLPLGIVLAVLVSFRRQLARTAFNRGAALGLAGWVATLSLGRALSLLAGHPPSVTFLQDLVLIAAVATTVAALFDSAYALIAIVGFVGAAVVALRPDQGAVVFAISSGLALMVGTLAVFRSAR